MLNLNIKKGQKVRIGSNIDVAFEGFTRDGAIRLSFDAPREITILRHELLKERNPKTFKSTGDDLKNDQLTVALQAILNPAVNDLMEQSQ